MQPLIAVLMALLAALAADNAQLVGTKDFDTMGSPYGENINTCCEGTETRIVGSQPEFIFSTAEDGLYVNLFETVTITCSVAKMLLREWNRNSHSIIT
jgi:DUF1680 family protein